MKNIRKKKIEKKCAENSAYKKQKDLQARSLEDKPKDVHREPNKTIQIKDYA